MQSRLFLITFLSAWLDGKLVVESKTFADANRTVKFSLTNRKNITGHVVTRLMMDKSSMELPDNWKVDIENRFLECNGMKSVYLLGVFTVPPTVPTDYELFTGVGYYKFHSTDVLNFDDALAACFKEGGHLAIINSQEESDVMQQLWKRYPETSDFAYDFAFVGIHDRQKEGEFITIFGQHITSTGFNKWTVSNPDNSENNENCGSVYRDGHLNDINCMKAIPFVCEYDLSWNS